MKIPFVVIVQAHLLRDKGSVRLRCVTGEGTIDTSGATTNEQLVEVENLAFTIRELSAETIAAGNDILISSVTGRPAPRDAPSMAHLGQSTKDSRNQAAAIDCIYVDHEQYYDSDRPASKPENWKVIVKTMKSVSQRGEQFIAGMIDPSSGDVGGNLPIFAVADISFWALRDFGTSLMKRSRSERSAAGACHEVTEVYPKFKRIIKTLGSAIESFMKKNGYWLASGHRSASTTLHQETSSSQASVVTILLYSRTDDRFDMVSLEAGSAQDEHTKHSRRR